MIRTPLPALDSNYVYSIQDLDEFEGYSLSIYDRYAATYYDDNTPLASVGLAEYPSDFEMVIRQAVVILAREHPEYYTTTLPDTYHFYTQALYSTVSEDEIR